LDSSAESGLFNGLQRIQIKKSALIALTVDLVRLVRIEGAIR
jgi:hypothetical protein